MKGRGAAHRGLQTVAWVGRWVAAGPAGLALKVPQAGLHISEGGREGRFLPSPSQVPPGAWAAEGAERGGEALMCKHATRC